MKRTKMKTARDIFLCIALEKYHKFRLLEALKGKPRQQKYSTKKPLHKYYITSV